MVSFILGFSPKRAPVWSSVTVPVVSLKSRLVDIYIPVLLMIVEALGGGLNSARLRRTRWFPHGHRSNQTTFQP